MMTRGSSGNAGRSRALVAGAVMFLLSTVQLSCRQGIGRLTGQMFVPPGMAGKAQWGDVWLVRGYDELDADLHERERLLVLSLLGKDAEFLRTERGRLLQLAAVRAKLEALNRGEIPVRVVMPQQREISPLMTMDSVIAGVQIVSRAATAPELATEIDRQKQQLKDSMYSIRDEMEPSVKRLREQRSEQKRVLLAGADRSAQPLRVMSSPVGMDGRYLFDSVPVGDFGLYSRYRLLDWFVLTPVTTGPGVVVKDIPRLPGAVLDSKAIVSLEALCAEIARR